MFNNISTLPYSKGLLANFINEKQQKYKTFLPALDSVIPECDKLLNEIEFKDEYNTFQLWKESREVYLLRKCYDGIINKRLLKNIGNVRRKILYLFVIEKCKSHFTSDDLDWIENELFSICLYEEFENLYPTFIIWRIKYMLSKFVKDGQDIRKTMKENWIDYSEYYKSMQSKFEKLKHLSEQFYNKSQFHWLRAEVYLLDIIFETYKCYNILEKCRIAYQLYRSYHSIGYHIKCGDSLYKLCYLLQHSIPNDILIQIYNMILVCYNKYIQDGYREFEKKSLSFNELVLGKSGEPKCNISFYTSIIIRLEKISDNTEIVSSVYNKMKDIFDNISNKKDNS